MCDVIAILGLTNNQNSEEKLRSSRIAATCLPHTVEASAHCSFIAERQPR